MRSRWKCPDVSLRMASSRLFLNSERETQGRHALQPISSRRRQEEGRGVLGAMRCTPPSKGQGDCDLQADPTSVRLSPNHTQEVLPLALCYLSYLPPVQTAGRAGSRIKAPRVGGGRR